MTEKVGAQKKKKLTVRICVFLVFFTGFIQLWTYIKMLELLKTLPEGQQFFFESTDMVVRNAIIGIRCDFLTVIFKSLTYIGNAQSITVICIALLLMKNTRSRYGLPVTLAVICSSSLQTIIKHIVERPRPEISEFLISQGGYSFPSGHSCSGLVFYGFLIYLINKRIENRKKANIMSIALSLLIMAIGFSRVYLGVHYPSDVMGGWCLGGAILVVAIMIYDKGERICQK